MIAGKKRTDPISSGLRPAVLAWSAFRDFLRGFVGIASMPTSCGHDHATTPSSAREAFSDLAGRRGRCC